MIKKSKELYTIAIVMVFAMLPIVQAETIPGVSVQPGDSYVWKISRQETDIGGNSANSTYYRLINVTAVSTEVDSTEITYDDFVANESEYEGNELTTVSWNETSTDSKLFLNNSAVENNFGGFVNLENGDLEVLEDLNESEQVEFFLDFLLVASYDFQLSYGVMWIISILFFPSKVVDVNSSVLASASENHIEGTFMIGFSL